MPALFIFLLKVNVALIIFCLGYYLVLRKLTFYTLNRVYLVGAIVLSSVYPLIDVNDLLARHQEIAAPVQVVAINWQKSQQLVKQPVYWQWAIMLFWLGAAVFATRLSIQFLSLYKLYRKSSPAIIQQYRVRITDADISPFSFWKNIYINPNNIEAADLSSVLEHEQVHVKEWHTLDILLTELSVVCYWFNPGVWLMKRAVRENIEFITDRKVLQTGADTKAYQYSLLHVSLAGTTSAGISNHFNFSTLKKRIKMMNTKKSSNLNLTRYAVLVPMVVVLLMVFSFSKAELIKKNRKQLTDFIAETINDKAKPATKTEAKLVAKAAKNKTKVSKDTTTTEPKGLHYVKVKGVNLPIGVPYGIYAKAIEVSKDTIKFISIDKGDQPDSVKIMINGKLATNQQIAKIVANSTTKHELQQAKSLVGKLARSETNKSALPITFFYKGDSDSTKHFVPVSRLSDKGGFVTYSAISPTANKVVELTAVGDKVKATDGSVSITSSKLTFIPDKASQPKTVSDKLIIIDGKEVTEKEKNKLPVSKLEKVQIMDASKELTDKYGDKAKNGVIFYTTKKDK